MKVQMKKVVATVAMAGAITAGTAGMAYAQDSSGSGSEKPAATAKGHPRLRVAVRRHAGQDRCRHPRYQREDLRAALKSGQSVNDVAGSPEKQGEVKAALVNAANTAIDKAVTNGRIDEAKGAELKGKVEASGRQGHGPPVRSGRGVSPEQTRFARSRAHPTHTEFRFPRTCPPTPGGHVRVRPRTRGQEGARGW